MARDLSLTVAGIHFDNPFYVASGPTTKSVRQLLRIEECGWAAASIKLSIDPAPYINRKPRYGVFDDRGALAFTAEKRLTAEQGIRLIREAKPQLKTLKLLANITYAGDRGPEGGADLAARFEEAGADAIELNMCCPNMSFNLETTSGGEKKTAQQTGASMGQNSGAAEEVVRAVKRAIRIPLFVKLTPEGGQIAHIAKALYAAGADVVGGTGNRLGMSRIDLEHPERSCYQLQEEISMGCYSGAWLKPLAQRDVYEIRKVCGMRVPVTACGGIVDGRDAIEMVLCGGTLLGVCAETLMSGYDIVRPMIRALGDYMDRHGYRTLDELRGLVVPEMKAAPEVTLHAGYARIREPGLAAPCKSACPLHMPTQAYTHYIARGEFEKAYRLVRDHAPMRELCALLCQHPCEDACVRGRNDSPVRLRALERFILAWGRERETEDAAAPELGLPVAVVGAGPSGLTCAAQLRQAGYQVTVLDRAPGRGSLASIEAGTPEKAIAALEARGVAFRTGTLGETVTVEELAREGFRAVYLALGAEGIVPAGIPGEERATDAVAYLLEEKAEREDGRVVVIGHGYAALYAARRAAETHPVSVTLLWTEAGGRSFDADCFSRLEALGVSVLRQVTVTELREGSVGLRLHGAALSLPCDRAVLEHEGKRRAADGGAGRNMPVRLSDTVWMGGAAVRGGSVADAMACGRNAAAQIDAFLRGEEATVAPVPAVKTVAAERVLQRVGYLKKDRGPALTREPDVFDDRLMTEEEAVREASRCLACGCGEGCQRCKTICCEFAPEIEAPDTMTIRADRCAACGMCAQRCPNGNIEMVELPELV